jgi:AbrB family looped-hinge helix DNA binding protein
MRINAKGQITIPKVIRERAGLLPGTEVDFLCEGDVVKIVPLTHKPRMSGAQVVEHLRGRGSLKYTTDKIMKMTRG